jgi:hypothetical protein
MPRGPHGEKRPADVIGNAVMVAKIATGEVEDTKTEKKAHKLTPAMAAGLTSSPMELGDLVQLIDVREQAQLRGKRQALLEAAE